jgi:hypothetical protein
MEPAMMPPVERGLLIAFALVTLVALLGAIGTAIYAGSLRYRGRPIPGRVLRLAAGLLGLGQGSGFVYFIEDPSLLVPIVIFSAFPAYWLVRRGKWVAGGLLIAMLGLPGALWWGFFVVQDLLDPLGLYDAVLWLWWAPEVAFVVIGSLIASRGDRRVAPTELLKRAPSHVRDPIALANAFQRELAVGPIPIQVLVGLAVAAPVLVFGIPYAIAAGVPWPVALVLGTVAYSVVSAEVWQFSMPRRVRGAWEGFTLVSNPETKRWMETTGSQIPRTLPAMRRWLEHNPDRPETRWARSELMVVVGDLAEARAVAEAMPLSSDWDRFEQRSLLEHIDWVEGGEIDLDGLRQLAETVGEPGSSERLTARGEVALAVARDLAVSGGDWKAPLVAIRDEAGAELAGRLFRQESRRHLYPQLLVMGAAFAAIVTLASLLTG